MHLIPFTTDVCAMCGWRRQHFRYCLATHVIGIEGPHLHRTCERCGYEWQCQTMDPAESAAPVIDTPYVAEALLTAIAHGLARGVTDLDRAAFTLKELGKGVPANAAHSGAVALRRLYTEVTGRELK